jgi:hypothetical protein
MPPRKVLRDFRYETEAQEAIDNACEVWLRADDQVNLMEWVILRDHNEGLPLTESGLVRTLTIQGAASISSPTVTFVYEIEPHRICVKAAKFDEAQKIQ